MDKIVLNNKLIQEFQNLKIKRLPVTKKDWDTIWVLTGKAVTLLEEGSSGNDTLRRFNTAVSIAKEVCSKRLKKNIDLLKNEDMETAAPKIYMSGYNSHNETFLAYLKNGFFEKHFKFPGENIIIGPKENIIHTGHQFQKFPNDIFKKSKNIVLITDAYHLPRAWRYAKYFFDDNSLKKIIFYPALPIDLNKKKVLSEIKKIEEYFYNE